MGRRPWVTYLWPGLSGIWSKGSWSALAAATGFAVLVNLGLLATFLWSELLTPGVRNLVWLAALVIWAASAAFSYRRDRRDASSQDGGRAEGDEFRDALHLYLKRNWFESEHLLRSRLGSDPGDLDACLMLATLLRRTGRIDEAERQLDWLERSDGSEKWQLEIRCEWDLLGQARREQAAEPVRPNVPAPADPYAEAARAA
jgi:hypothetical protein